MKKLLIVDSSDILAESLIAILHKKFDIRVCTDSKNVVETLHSYRPECLVINIDLPVCDGITLLRQAAYRPLHMIALTKTPMPYALQSLVDLGADHILLLPCSAQAIACHLENIIRLSLLPKQQHDPREVVKDHLRILGFPEDHGAFLALCIEAVLYSQDPYQSLSKELHPATAQICGYDNGDQVESNIRRMIAKVWAERNQAVWYEYFPNQKERPKIRQFLSMLTQKLNLMCTQRHMAQNE